MRENIKKLKRLMKIYNTKIKELCLDLIDKEDLTILWNIEEFEEKINSYSLDYYEESYLMVEALKAGAADQLILNRHISIKDQVDYLHTYHSMDENDALFIVAMMNDIIYHIDWNIEIINLEEAYQYALERDSIKDLRVIAFAYYDGLGVIQDYERAYELFLKLEYLGDDESYYYLGMMNELGLGTPVNKKQAIDFYRKGASLSENECLYALGKIEMNQGNVNDSVEYLSDSEDPRAYYLLGEYYRKNNDFFKAYTFYKKGSVFFHKECLYKLGYCYQYGSGTVINKDKAIQCYSYAYYLGDRSSAEALVYMLEGINEDHRYSKELLNQLRGQYEII